MSYMGGGVGVTIRAIKYPLRALSFPFLIVPICMTGVGKFLEKAITKRARLVAKQRLDVEFLEVTVTSRCSLQCFGCANLMQYYGINENKRASDVPLATLQGSLLNFLTCVDSLQRLHIIGGEPFLYKDLKDFLAFALSQPKVRRIELTSNGTIIPKDVELVALLQNPRVSINITYYGEEISCNTKGFREFAKEQGIKLSVCTDKVWLSYGNMKQRNKSQKELNAQFAKCVGCLGMINYELHYCARGRHGTDLGIVEKRSDDFVDLSDISLREKKREEIKRYMRRKEYISACDHCDIQTEFSHSLTPGDQRATHNIHMLTQ